MIRIDVYHYPHVNPIVGENMANGKQEIFEEMFEDLEERIQDWYKLIKCDPNYVLHYHDGEKVELSTDMTKMKLEIEKWEGKDGWARFLDFMNEVGLHYLSRRSAFLCGHGHAWPRLERTIPSYTALSDNSLAEGDIEMPNADSRSSISTRAIFTMKCPSRKFCIAISRISDRYCLFLTSCEHSPPLATNSNSFLTFPCSFLSMAEKLHVFDKLYRRASNYFWTERMRRAFSFSSMYRELAMLPMCLTAC